MNLKRHLAAAKDKASEVRLGLLSLEIEKYTFLVLCTFLLGLLDSIFVLGWLKTELTIFANPFLYFLIAWGDLQFLAFKNLINFIGCCVLFLNRKRKLGQLMISSFFIIFLVTSIYHAVSAWAVANPDDIPKFVEDVLIQISK